MAKFGVLSPITSATLLVGFIFAPTGSALAKPPNAANPSDGNGCLVADANGDYSYDAECEYHIVSKQNKDGSRALVSYHDHGNLPDGAPLPTKARKNDVSYTFADGTTCSGTEITTPSGEYHSDCKFNASN